MCMFLPMSHVIQYTCIAWVHSYIFVASAWPEGPDVYTALVGAACSHHAGTRWHGSVVGAKCSDGVAYVAPLGMRVRWVQGIVIKLWLLAGICSGCRIYCIMLQPPCAYVLVLVSFIMLQPAAVS